MPKAPFPPSAERQRKRRARAAAPPMGVPGGPRAKVMPPSHLTRPEGRQDYPVGASICIRDTAVKQANPPRTWATLRRQTAVHQNRHGKCAGEAGGKARGQGWQQGCDGFTRAVRAADELSVAANGGDRCDPPGGTIPCGARHNWRYRPKSVPALQVPWNTTANSSAYAVSAARTATCPSAVRWTSDARASAG